jgi:hypothetical protein
MATTFGSSVFSDPLALGPASAEDVIELPVLLPEWQVAALEEAARDRGMTVGQLLRKLFADLFPRRPALADY